MTVTEAPDTIELYEDGLDLVWQEERYRLAASTLRRHCRCTQCQTLRFGGLQLPVSEDLRLRDARHVGHYGLQLVFSDGHERGIFPWAYLRELAGSVGV